MEPTQHPNQTPEQTQEENATSVNLEASTEPQTISETPSKDEPIAIEPTPDSISEDTSIAENNISETVIDETQEKEEPQEIIATTEEVEYPKEEEIAATPKEEAQASDFPAKEIIDIQQETELVSEEADEDTEDPYEFDADLETLGREKLVSMMEEIVKNPDVNDIKSRVALIKVAYLKISNKEQQDKLQEVAGSEDVENFEVSDPLEERFKAAFNIYKTNKSVFNEEQERQKLVNLEIKKGILEELKTLINSEETLKKTYDEFKILQDKWKEIGMVPKAEANGLWQSYHFLIEKFFDKVKINKELKDLDLRKNLERKIELCEKAEELMIETSITKSFKRLQELHEEWKEVGPVAQDKRDEVWYRFKTATEKINDRRHEYFKTIQTELDANYAAKILLCEQAEQLVAGEYTTLKQWQDSTRQVNELLKVWKTIGQAPNKVNNEIWARFKGQMDQYFTNKKEFFGNIKDQHLNNYNLKVELCLQAESHKASTDWKNSTRELIRLQDEWKKIGPVPRKYSDKIWKRFRTACDEFFNAKNDFFKNINQNENENLTRKKELIQNLQAFEFSENRQDSLANLKNIQREWMEIGHVPIKEKDKLQSEYKAVLDKIYEKLKVDTREANQMNYKARFDNLKDQPEASKIINRERSGLQNKIDSLKEEILLWENNIGFFAKSKQPNLLKQEFENKINLAKEELSALESKMKFLKNAAQEQQTKEKE